MPLQTYESYKAQMLMLLGDEECRRYRESYLNIGLKLALELYGLFFPCRAEVSAAAVQTGRKRWRIEFNWQEERRTLLEILSVSAFPQERRPIAFTIENEVDSSLLIRSRDALSSRAVLIFSVPHCIAGFDSCPPDGRTTIPQSHQMLICYGAAGFAMQTRAAAVAEVFNRWPDDKSTLMRQSEVLIAAFEEGLKNALKTDARFLPNPFPQKGFEV